MKSEVFISNSKSKTTKIPLNRSVKKLRVRIKRLASKEGALLDNAVCDILDLRGFALASLLDRLPTLKGEIKKSVATRIEDYLFFHPERGRKVVPRLVAAINGAEASFEANLVAALADVVVKLRKRVSLPWHVAESACRILASNADFMRKSKAVELISYNEQTRMIPVVIKSIEKCMEKVDRYESFQFIESALFALKRLGGDGLLRLLVNPQSKEGLAQFRIEWRNRSKLEERDILKILSTIREDFSELIIKVIDLTEFSLPFLAAIQEGLRHSDKWVRHMATGAAAKLVNEDGLEHLTRMLEDESREVRMMAVNSLGNFPVSMIGERLYQLAGNVSESLEIRMNALFALFTQKNRVALQTLSEGPFDSISLNARGLEALLMPAGDGLEHVTAIVHKTPIVSLPGLFHYLMELAEPEDLPRMIALFSSFSEEERKHCFLDFLAAFLENKAGPNLEKAVAALKPGERRTVEILWKNQI